MPEGAAWTPTTRTPTPEDSAAQLRAALPLLNMGLEALSLVPGVGTVARPLRAVVALMMIGLPVEKPTERPLLKQLRKLKRELDELLRSPKENEVRIFSTQLRLNTCLEMYLEVV